MEGKIGGEEQKRLPHQAPTLRPPLVSISFYLVLQPTTGIGIRKSCFKRASNDNFIYCVYFDKRLRALHRI